MVLGGLWKYEDIEKIERQLYKQTHILPNDINGASVVNLVRNGESTWKTVARLAENTSNKDTKQTKLPFK